MLTLNFIWRRLEATSQASRSTADDDYGFFQARHLAQGERVPRRPQINHVAQTDPGYGRSNGPAAHGETGFVELDRLAVPHDREAAVNV